MVIERISGPNDPRVGDYISVPDTELAVTVPQLESNDDGGGVTMAEMLVVVACVAPPGS